MTEKRNRFKAQCVVLEQIQKLPPSDKLGPTSAAVLKNFLEVFCQPDRKPLLGYLEEIVQGVDSDNIPDLGSLLLEQARQRIAKIKALYHSSALKNPPYIKAMSDPKVMDKRIFKKIYNLEDITNLPKPEKPTIGKAIDIKGILETDRKLTIPKHDEEIIYSKKNGSFITDQDIEPQYNIWLPFQGPDPHPFTPLECLREIFQNFADEHVSGGSSTLEDVRFTTRPEVSNTIIRIEGKSTFHPNFLLTNSLSSKIGDPGRAGNHGDGIKTAISNLIKSHGVESIQYGSRNWEVYFRQGPINIGAGKSINGVLRKIDQTTKKKNSLQDIDGSFCELKIPTSMLQTYIDILEQAINLFYYPDNPNFFSEGFSYKNGEGGFAFHESPELGGAFRIRLANAVHEPGLEALNPFPQFSVWSNFDLAPPKNFSPDRNRLPISMNQVREYIIAPVINAMSDSDLAYCIGQCKELWNDETINARYSSYPKLALLRDLVRGAKRKSIGFSSKSPDRYPYNLSELQPQEGKPHDTFPEEVPCEKELMRLNLLKRAAKLLDQETNGLTALDENIYPGGDPSLFIYKDNARKEGDLRISLDLVSNEIDFRSALQVYFYNTRSRIQESHHEMSYERVKRLINRAYIALNRLGRMRPPIKTTISELVILHTLEDYVTRPPENIVQELEDIEFIWNLSQSNDEAAQFIQASN